MKRPRVLLADDHQAVLNGIRRLLERDFEVVEAVRDGQALVAAAEKLRPDVMVVDVSMPLLSGIEAARQLKQSNPDAKIVFLSIHQDPALIKAALRTGALGYVLKVRASADLLLAVREALEGHSFVSPPIRQ